VRLLDCVAQSNAPFLVKRPGEPVRRLTGAADYARVMEQAPLRYVLADGLVRSCIALAYSGGDQLAGCIDLIRIPSELMWIEWAEVPRLDELYRHYRPAGSDDVVPCGTHRAGLLLRSDRDGRRGSLRTFWTTAGRPEEPILSPIETVVDFSGAVDAATDPEALLDGKLVSVSAEPDASLNALLRCAAFRFDPAWLAFYRDAVRSRADRESLVSKSLGTVGFDVPVLSALLLLLGIRSELVWRPSTLERLNAKRARGARPQLLEHVEISAPLLEYGHSGDRQAPDSGRQSPRMHHVRGHLVRQRHALYWRRPHWRGHVRIGTIRSRTVELTLGDVDALRVGAGAVAS
jgi:hypothetical protein